MAQPKLPPQTPYSISCRWGTRAAGQWPISQAKGSDLTRDKTIREETGVWAKASDNCIEEDGVHRKYCTRQRAFIRRQELICFMPLYSRLLFVIFTLLLIKSFLSLFFSCSCHCRFITLYKGPCHTHKVQRLNESTSYTFRIQAFNEAGEGPFSNVYTFTTPRSPPAPVKGIVAALSFLFPSFSLYLCGSALINFRNTHCWHKDNQCAQLLTSVDPSSTCIWLQSSGPRFACRLSSWVGVLSTVVWFQPASAKPLLILRIEVSNEDVGFILNAAPL